MGWIDDFMRAHGAPEGVKYNSRTGRWERIQEGFRQNARPKYEQSGNTFGNQQQYAVLKNCTIIENVGFEPMQCYQRDNPITASAHSEMIVSSFLYDLHIKQPRCFWHVIMNLGLYQTMYKGKLYYQIFQNLSKYAFSPSKR